MKLIIDIDEDDFMRLQWTTIGKTGVDHEKKMRNIILAGIPYEDKWIPVIERLPEEDGEYEVTRAEYVPSKPDHHTFDTEGGSHWDLVVDIAKFETQRINEYNNGFDKVYKVIAWRLLPEPYKVGGEEE